MSEVNDGAPRADNVGIVALEAYFPSTYVDQSDLEAYDCVAAGKYTIGLGQHQMAVCSDLEDACSIALTVTRRLMRSYALSPTEIGRIEVGSESNLDRSKSIKTFLMPLFADGQHTDIGGVDSVNACFGATQALFNAVDWVESGHWDGRYALVVAADIAVYDRGPARCSGGAGAVAVLIGCDAPIVFHHRVRSYHVDHVYDFYKPTAGSEYPIVDGQLSVQSYFDSLNRCYALYCDKYEGVFQKRASVESFDAVLFHSPYSKLVQKSFARLVYFDLIRGRLSNHQHFDCNGISAEMATHGDVSALDGNKSLESSMIVLSQNYFAAKTEKSLWLTKRVGNMYTASLYAAMVSHLLMSTAEDLRSQRMLLFSYGSGSVACMFSLEIRCDRRSADKLTRILDVLRDRSGDLDRRRKVTPGEFDDMLKARQALLQKVPNRPTSDVRILFPGTFYVAAIDDRYRRQYAFKE